MSPSIALHASPPKTVQSTLLILTIGLTVFTCSSLQAQLDSRADKIIEFTSKHCNRCHGREKQEGGLRLDTMDVHFQDNRSRDAWVEVLDRINLGEMPPADEPQPTSDELEVAVSWITLQLQSLHAKRVSTNGRVLLRRLSRTEYTNTIRDLLGIEFPAGEGPQDLLPPDGTIHGFNKMSKALLLDPSLMEKYLAAAEIIADRAVRIRPPLVPTRTMRFEFENTERARGIGYQVTYRSMNTTTDGVMVYDGQARTGYELKHPFNGESVPVTGEYIIRVRAAADSGERGDPIFMDFKRGQQGRLRRFRVDAPLARPRVYEFQGILDASISAEIQVGLVNGTHTRIHNPITSLDNIRRSDLNDTAKQKENRRTLARYRAEGFGRYVERPNLKMLDLTIAPRLFLDYIELEGPLHGPWPPRSMSIIFPDGWDEDKHSLFYVRKIFRRLLPRAYRRPVSGVELSRIVRLVQNELDRDKPFHEAVKVGIVAMLCSPQFLYLLEPPGQLPRQTAEPQVVAERVFRDARGRAVSGRAVSVGGDTFVLERSSDRRKFTLPITSFSENDQRYLRSLATELALDNTNIPPRRLTEFELAARLSYFIWSSMPDEALLRAAANGQLSNPQRLDAQIDRMLADDRAEALVTDFASQWLRIDEFDRFAPDRQIFPDYYSVTNAGVGDDMKQEPLAMFREVLKNDESLLSFLDADWTMLNQRLAGFYGIENVTGDHFRRVSLPAGSPRGGLLGMAGVHKWGSDGSRTKPVERGKYVLDVLFNDAPPPPPPNAGEIQPNIQGENLTVRERLQQHRTVTTCANCHRRIDPYGIGLENFNVIGRWRDKQDGEKPLAHWGDQRRNLQIQGRLPNGTEYANHEQFKRALSQQHERFVIGLSEKMFIYALGRSIEASDRSTIANIVRDVKNRDYSLQTMLKRIVASDAFQTK